jgi:hypothetical protein
MLKLKPRGSVRSGDASTPSPPIWYFVVCQILAVLCLPSPATAASPPYSSIVLTGASTNALLQAYISKANIISALDAPFILETQTIEIVERNDEILIGFFPNRVNGSMTLTVKDGKVISHDSSPITLDVKPILLPGVIAGEIIAAYSTALKRNDLVTRAWEKSPFNAEVLVGAGGCLVSFVPQEPVSLPNYKCIAGNCDARSNYLVRIETGKAIVTHRW